MQLSDDIAKLKGVGTEVAKKLAILNIVTIGDLVNNYPRRYEDYSNIVSIDQINPGPVTIKSTIKQVKGRYVSRGLHVTEAVASDDTSSVRLVWFNQPYREAGIKPDQEYFISGEFGFHRRQHSIQNPSVELAEGFTVNTARIVPVYRETKGFKSHQIRKLVRAAVPLIKDLPETLPDWLIKKQKLMPRASAIMAMHFPNEAQDVAEAEHRLGFEEVFELTLAALLNKQELAGEHSLNIPFEPDLAKQFVKNLPFKLTDAQRSVVWQIYKDMERSQPMNRLVEGDVGSGKTVVAAMAAVMVMKQGFQVALMAPTELLARQHADTIHKLLEPLGMADQVSLLIGGLSSAQKATAQAGIKSGQVQFIVGTHALIQQKVDMHKLGLIIVDEQHRFGVDQRKKLQAKAGHMPHVLNLTATPIPRSLALTLYGELDVSIIDTKPADRLPIATKICSPNSRPQLYVKIVKELQSGRQSFVVCPLITESTALSANSAEKTYETLRKGPFKQFRVGLLHGRLKSEEKDKIMQQFVNHHLDILVSTTVIEVGVDVPNATVMLIENAERFGLAQIHQLRGRVGRSHYQGYCYLMMGDSSAPSARLRAIESSNDGFKLAELDLEIRGPGAIYGTFQHGELDLRVAKLTDTKLIAAARQSAQEFIDRGDKMLSYKHLNDTVSQLRAVTNLN